MNRLFLFVGGLILIILFVLTSCSKGRVVEDQTFIDAPIEERKEENTSYYNHTQSKVTVTFTDPANTDSVKIHLNVDYYLDGWQTCCNTFEYESSEFPSNGTWVLDNQICVDLENQLFGCGGISMKYCWDLPWIDGSGDVWVEYKKNGTWYYQSITEDSSMSE